jgi:hypothetical protein
LPGEAANQSLQQAAAILVSWSSKSLSAAAAAEFVRLAAERCYEMNPPHEVVLTLSNVGYWPAFKKLLDEGKLVADKKGRLRYPHGAPVGKMILVRINKDGTPRYAESAQEWFDPGSQKAREFVWPE